MYPVGIWGSVLGVRGRAKLNFWLGIYTRAGPWRLYQATQPFGSNQLMLRGLHMEQR